MTKLNADDIIRKFDNKIKLSDDEYEVMILVIREVYYSKKDYIKRRNDKLKQLCDIKNSMLNKVLEGNDE